jgi:hypothetical protein
MAGTVTEVFKWDASPITILSANVKARVKVQADTNPPSLRAAFVVSESLHTFGGQSREAAENARALAGALHRIATDRDPFGIRRSAPAVFHLLRVGREYHDALEVRARNAKDRVHAALAAFGKPFDSKSARTHALKVIDPHFRFGRGDASRPPFDAATLSDPDFILRYLREEWIGRELGLLVLTTHWYTERILTDTPREQGDGRLSDDLKVALRRHGFWGAAELSAFAKIVMWRGPRRRKKTSSEKKPGPYRIPASIRRATKED